MCPEQFIPGTGEAGLCNGGRPLFIDRGVICNEVVELTKWWLRTALGVRHDRPLFTVALSGLYSRSITTFGLLGFSCSILFANVLAGESCGVFARHVGLDEPDCNELRSGPDRVKWDRKRDMEYRKLFHSRFPVLGRELIRELASEAYILFVLLIPL